MKTANVAAYLVPSCDAHNSEYLANRDKRRAFISGKWSNDICVINSQLLPSIVIDCRFMMVSPSHDVPGFDGSAGTVLVTQTAALLWTDGRYFSQAEKQLDKNSWTLMREGEPATPTR